MLRTLIIYSVVLFSNSVIPTKKTPPAYKIDGCWEINKTKSDFGNLDQDMAAPSTIIIKTENEALILTRFINGVKLQRDTLITGKPLTIDNKTDGFTKTSSITFLESKNEFIIKSVFKDDGGGKSKDFDRTEEYRYSEQTNELTVTKINNMPEGKIRIIAVYDFVLPTHDYDSMKRVESTINSSGEWELDTTASKLSNFFKSFAAPKLNIVQSRDSLVLQNIFKDGVNELKLPIDGSEILVIGQDSNGNSYSNVSKMITMQKGFLVFLYRKIPKQVLFEENIYTISDDGRTLTNRWLIPSEHSAYSVKLIYKKIK